MERIRPVAAATDGNAAFCQITMDTFITSFLKENENTASTC